MLVDPNPKVAGRSEDSLLSIVISSLHWSKHLPLGKGNCSAGSAFGQSYNASTDYHRLVTSLDKWPSL